jgi:hypothetical protein
MTAAPRLRAGRLPATGSGHHPDAVPFQAYLHLVRRHVVVVALLGTLGLGVGLAAASRQTSTWVSGATVMAPAIARDPLRPPDKVVRRRQAVTIDSEAAVLLSENVLRRAASGVAVTTAQLAANTTVTAVPNSRVLRIQVRDTDRIRARVLAGNLADAYLDSRQQLLAERRSQQSESLRRQIASLQEPARVAARAYSLLHVEEDADPGYSALRGQDRAGADGSQEALGSVTDINIRLAELRQELIDLEASSVKAGELLRNATAARRLDGQPQVPVVSWLLVGLSAAGVVVAVRERRPPSPVTVADVMRMPAARTVPVGALDEDGPAHDPSAGWVRMADAIGSGPATVTVVPLDGVGPAEAIGRLSAMLRRRGYAVAELLDFDHFSPDSGGAMATMCRVRSGGQHAIVEGPPLAAFAGSLSAAETDAVVLIMTAGAVSQSRLAAAVDELSRLGLPLVGVILDRTGGRPSSRGRLRGRLW